MASQLSQKRAFDSPAIPDRLYFKIGDVAKICAVETYVLRFWETEFPQLKPNKSGTGQRLYRRRDVELALEIKRLVHVEGYTLAGARQVLGQGSRHSEPSGTPSRVCPWWKQSRESAGKTSPPRLAAPAPSCARLPVCWLRRSPSRGTAARA